MAENKSWTIALLAVILILSGVIAWLVLRLPDQIAETNVESVAVSSPAAAPADTNTEQSESSPAVTEVESDALPEPTEAATAEPATAVPEATNTPPPAPTETPVPEPTPMPTQEPTAVPTPEPTPAVVAALEPAWLAYFNLFREMGGVPPVPEQAALTMGSQLHSQYMVVNDIPIAHSEDVNNPLYDEAGHLAGKNGNIFATSQLDANYVWGINFWVSAPFHLIPMLHPGLQTAGYGDYVEDIGDFHMAAVLDIRSDRVYSPDGVEYPLYFPKNGSSTWVVRHSLYEWPDSLESCPGFSRPTGAPIVLQLGDGSLTPNVTSYGLAMGDQPLAVCMFNETNFRNSNAYAQATGRSILDIQDAIVLMPKEPLAADRTYTVQIAADGETYTWRFNTIKRPPNQ